MSTLPKKRNKFIAYAAIANFFSKIASMLVIILGVSFTLNYLSSEKFGIWMTISSLIGLLSFLDLGIGNALTNTVSKSFSTNNRNDIKDAVTGGLFILFFVAIFVFVFLTILLKLLPIDQLFKTQNELDQIILTSLEMFVACFSITIFSNGIQRIFHGMQLGFLVHIMLTIGSIISLVLLYYFSTLKVEINLLVFASMIGNILASIPLLIILISKDLFCFRGVLFSINSQYKNIINLGGAFFLIQIGTIILIGADSLIISSTIGVSGVAIFAITQRLFLFASQPMQLVNVHLWPAFADANNRQDKDYIRKTLKISIMLTLFITTLISIIIVIFSNQLISIWTSEKIEVPIEFIYIFALWIIIESVSQPIAMFMNSCGIMKPQIFGIISLIIICLPLKIYLASNFGIFEMVAAYTIFFSINIVFWYGFIFRSYILKYLY